MQIWSRLIRFSASGALMCIAAAAICPKAVLAFTPAGPPGYKWPGGVYNYRINVTSFQQYLGSLSLTAAQVAYWIPYAMSAWRERTGIDGSLTLNYVGTSTASNNTCTNHDGTNQIYVVNGCRAGLNPPCTTLAETKTWPSPPVGSAITEADTCVYGGAAGPTAFSCMGGWRVRIDNFPSDQKDLIGLLVHEFGHTLGLGHYNYSVMQDGDYECGNILSRYPYGDDIDGMRSLYGYGAGGIPAAYWREKVASPPWSGEVAVTPADGVWPVLASVGRSGTGSKVVVGELSDNGDVIAFNRATYPLTTGSTWTAPTALVDSWRTPAVAGRPATYSSSEIWVAAVAKNNQLSNACQRLRMYRSTDTFTNTTFADQASAFGCGSFHEPALTFNAYRGRFVMLYVDREPVFSAIGNNRGKIFATTSVDGTSWKSPPNDLGIWTNDAVDIACAPATNSCVMTYVRASSNSPNLVNRQFSVDASGNVVAGNFTEITLFSERTPAAGAYVPSTAATFVIAAPVAADESDRGNSVYSQWVAENVTLPFPDFSYVVAAATSRRASLASLGNSPRIYLWYVR